MDLVLLLQILPLALGAALSPSVLLVQILVLASGPQGLARAWALAVGLTTALVVLGFVGYSLLAMLPDVSVGRPSIQLAIGEVVAGVVLLAVAVKVHYWPKPPGHHTSEATRFASMSPWLLVPVGFAWQFTELNTLALYLPAIHFVTNSAAPEVTKGIALLMLVVVTSVTWIGPPLAVSLRGEPAERRMQHFHKWLGSHSNAIKLWVCLVFGVGLIALAIVDLAQLYF